ncbi:hypothetical protein U1Q18_002625, partial [Sarracenia purpurea var. burkii]
SGPTSAFCVEFSPSHQILIASLNLTVKVLHNHCKLKEKTGLAKVWLIVWNRAGPRRPMTKDLEIFKHGWSLEDYRKNIQKEPNNDGGGGAEFEIVIKGGKLYVMRRGKG